MGGLKGKLKCNLKGKLKGMLKGKLKGKLEGKLKGELKGKLKDKLKESEEKLKELGKNLKELPLAQSGTPAPCDGTAPCHPLAREGLRQLQHTRAGTHSPHAAPAARGGLRPAPALAAMLDVFCASHQQESRPGGRPSGPRQLL